MMRKTAIVIGVLTTVGACAGSPTSGKAGEALDESIRIYNEGMRWQRYDAAASRIPARERAAFVDDWDLRSKDLKITDYDIVGVQHKGKEAKVQVKLSWYSDSEGTLHETSATQIWEQHGQAWFMVDEVRLRGTEMPGMAEHSKRKDKDAKGKDAKGKDAKDDDARTARPADKWQPGSPGGGTDDTAEPAGDAPSASLH